MRLGDNSKYRCLALYEPACCSAQYFTNKPVILTVLFTDSCLLLYYYILKNGRSEQDLGKTIANIV